MKRSFKLFFLPVIFIISLLLLASCHGKKSEKENFYIPDEFDTSNTYEITFWAKSDNNVTQKNIYEKAISDFEKLYPNVKISLKSYNDYGRIYNDVITNIATDTTPNICITYPDHIATYMSGTDTVVTLDPFIENEKFGLGGSAVKFDSVKKEEIIPEYLNECVLSNAYMALPFMRSTEACYINKDFVEALGYTIPENLTWDFIWEVSEAALKKDENGNFILNGSKVMIPFIYKSTDNMMIQLLKQTGGDYSDENGNIKIFNDTTKKHLYTIAEHTSTGAFSTFKISSYPGNFLNAGQCVFAIDSTAGATWIGTNAPNIDISEESLYEFEVAVKPIPQFDPHNPKMISQGPSVCIFNKDNPQEVLASWLFMQFLLTNNVQIPYSQTEGYVPVTSKARETKEYKDYLDSAGTDDKLHYKTKLDATKLLLENTDNTFVTPVFNGSASLRNAAGQMIENVAKSIRRKQTVDDTYMENLFAEMTSLYKLDNINNSSSGGIYLKELGKMPVESLVLISVIAGIWILFAVYFITKKIRFRKK